jgi:Lar family restriction alleviation protein
MYELKPCPFCGYPARLFTKRISTDFEYIVKCNKCRANVKYYKGKSAAVNAWNRRVNDG